MNKIPAGLSAGRASPMEINKRVESRDIDSCLGYLSLVNGIEGAVLYSREGLVVGSGEDSLETLFIEAPYFLSSYIEDLGHCRNLGLGALSSRVAFTDSRFHEITALGKGDDFFLVVAGTRGSYELFRLRIERGAQALAVLLHARGYSRG